MSILLNACSFYQLLLNKNYLFTLGLRAKEQTITLIFRKNDFKHLIGLQYLNDLGQLKTGAEVIYDKIKEQEITLLELERSIHYSERVETRLNDFYQIFPIFITQFSEPNFAIFRCSHSTVHPHSKITADYMCVFHYLNHRYYLFLKAFHIANYYYPISFFKESHLNMIHDNPSIQGLTILNCVEYSAQQIFNHKNYKKKKSPIAHQIILTDFH